MRQSNVGGGGGTVMIISNNDGVVTRITRAKNGDSVRTVNGKIVSGTESGECET